MAALRTILSENVEASLKVLFTDAMKSAFPQLESIPEPLITPGKKADYQCNNAMGLAKSLATAKPPTKLSPKEVGEILVKNLPPNDLLHELDPTPQGFINITISTAWAAAATQRVLAQGIQPPPVQKQKILVDFSSPNIAKEMHVGHLRSTIIGDSICRLFEFLGHDVSRINHVGDWGTQFGMLILYLKRKYPDFLTNKPNITDLVAFYKESKKMFDEDAEFKESARLEVVKLQRYEEESIKAWNMFCDLSRVEFQQIYDRLGIRLEERGESFYNPIIPEVVKHLESTGIVESSDGAKIIHLKDSRAPEALDLKDISRLLGCLIRTRRDGTLECSAALRQELATIKVLTVNDTGVELLNFGPKDSKALSKFDPQKEMDKLAKAATALFKPTLNPAIAAEFKSMNYLAEDGSVKIPRWAFPLMVVKSDGAATYDTTDLAAVYHRTQVEKYQRIVYVTDLGQFEHFNMVCQAATEIGWFANSSWDHAGFGMVLGEDGKKFKTRSGDTVKLKDLLDEAVTRTLNIIREREASEQKQGHTEEEMLRLAKAIGYGAVKYFDLKSNRTTDYCFNYDTMLALNGNTAVGLMYAYARICSVKRKAGVSDEALAEALATPGTVRFENDSEKQLALAALKFTSVITAAAQDLYLHRITDFVYGLVERYSDFYNNSRVVGSEYQTSRLLLCELVARSLKVSLGILGLEVAERL